MAVVYSREVILKGVWRYAIQSFEDFKSTHLVSYTADFLQLYTVPLHRAGTAHACTKVSTLSSPSLRSGSPQIRLAEIIARGAQGGRHGERGIDKTGSRLNTHRSFGLFG